MVMVASPGQPRKLAIIAGSGSLPLRLAEAARAAGREVHILGIEGDAGPDIARFPHSWIKWGQIARIFRILERHACQDIVMIGRVRRPDLTRISPDYGLFLHLPFILKLTIGGDDSLLGRIIGFFERRGYRILGAHEILPDLLCPPGILTRRAPRRGDLADIDKGMAALRHMGRLDIGQALVISRGHILAVEAAEGTDAMLARCGRLRQWGLRLRRGVLVKGPKPGQELRIDMPSVGPRTIENAAAAGLQGIALAAGQVLLAEREAFLAAADHHRLFVIGVE